MKDSAETKQTLDGDTASSRQTVPEAEEILQKFNRLFNGNPVPLAVSRLPEQRLTEVNDAFLRMLGYSREEVIGRTSEELGIFVQPDKHREIAQQLKAGGHISGCELKVRRKDGAILDGLFSGEVVESQEQKYFLTVMVDQTELKQIEKSLRQSEDRFFKAFQSSPYAITITRPEDGCFIDVNNAFSAITGFTREETLAGSSTGLRLWVHEDDRRRVVAALQAGRAVVGEEIPFRRKSGEVITGLFSAQMIQLSGGACVLSSIDDITERKEGEEKLRASEARFQFLAENMADVVFTVDLDLATTYVSPSIERMLGFTPAERMEQKAENQLTPQSLLMVVETLVEEMRQDRESRADPDRSRVLELEYFHKNGSIKCLVTYIRAIRDGKGEATGFYGAHHDITARKHAEAELLYRDRLLQAEAEALTCLLTAQNLTEAVEKTLGILGRILDVDRVYVFENTEEPGSGRLLMSQRYEWCAEGTASQIDNSLLQKLPYEDSYPELYRALSAGLPYKGLVRDLPQPDRDILSPQNILSIMVVPILIEDHFWGFVGFDACRKEKIWAAAEQNTLMATAAGIGHAVNRRRSIESLSASQNTLRKALGATVRSIAAVVETRDPYTSGHQKKVADLSRSIATEMGLTCDQVDGLRMAGLIHDIGKISVPAEILSKPTKLTDIEFSLISIHPQSGHDILKGVDFPWPIARMILEHHERMDGSGYPNGLRGDKLLLESRILAVADVVEAMASHRPYRAAIGIAAALEEIEKNQGTLYDRAVVETCLRLFREKGYKLPD